MTDRDDSDRGGKRKRPAARRTSDATTSKPQGERTRPRARARSSRPPRRSDSSAPVSSKPPQASSSLEASKPQGRARSAPEAAAEEPEQALEEIERQIGRLVEHADAAPGDPRARARVAEALRQIADRLGRPPEAPAAPAANKPSPTDYLRHWGRARSEDIDDFGLDPEHEARLRPLFEALYRHYFRVSASGFEHVPRQGRAILVGNHAGTFPWDGIMLKTAIALEVPERRTLRWLAEDFVFHMAFLGAIMNRIGAVRACQENAERLLAREELVAVFPEGLMGLGKLWRDRHRLQRFGRGGYIKLALRTGAPLVPVAVVGAEEAHPLLFKVRHLPRSVGLPFLPVTPTFPWLGPLGLLPLPSRWRIVVGEPIDLSGHGPEAAEDAVLVHRLNEKIRASVQSMLDRAVLERGSAFVG